MRLRDWPGRRIGRLWLVGGAVEALLIAALWVAGEEPPPVPASLRARADPAALADTVPSVDLVQALAEAGFTITREPLPSGDTIMRIGRDSSFVVARVRDRRTEVIDASPDVEQAVEAAGTVLAAVMDGLVSILLFLAAVLLPIPVLLVSITLVWAVVRRRRANEPGDDPGVTTG